MAGFQMAQHSDKPPIYYVHELSTTQNNSCFVCDRCSFLIVFVIFLYYNFYIKKLHQIHLQCTSIQVIVILTTYTLLPSLCFKTEGIVQCKRSGKNNLRNCFVSFPQFSEISALPRYWSLEGYLKPKPFRGKRC